MRLHQLATEWGLDVIVLLKAATTHGVGDAPDEEEVRLLKDAISGHYGLNDREIRKLEDFLYTERAAPLVSQASAVLKNYTGTEQELYLHSITKSLYDMLDDEDLKRRIGPETMYQTIMNLGVVMLQRSGAQSPQTVKELPTHLLHYNPLDAARVFSSHMMGIAERQPLHEQEDFTTIREKVDSEYEKLKSELGG